MNLFPVHRKQSEAFSSPRHGIGILKRILEAYPELAPSRTLSTQKLPPSLDLIRGHSTRLPRSQGPEELGLVPMHLFLRSLRIVGRIPRLQSSDQKPLFLAVYRPFDLGKGRLEAKRSLKRQLLETSMQVGQPAEDLGSWHNLTVHDCLAKVLTAQFLFLRGISSYGIALGLDSNGRCTSPCLYFCKALVTHEASEGGAPPRRSPLREHGGLASPSSSGR